MKLKPNMKIKLLEDSATAMDVVVGATGVLESPTTSEMDGLEPSFWVAELLTTGGDPVHQILHVGEFEVIEDPTE